MIIYPRFQKYAALAQLVERRLGKAEVGSSNLLGSSREKPENEASRSIREASFAHKGEIRHKKMYISEMYMKTENSIDPLRGEREISKRTRGKAL